MFGCFSKRKQTPNIKYLPIHVGSMYMCIKRIRRLPKGCDFSSPKKVKIWFSSGREIIELQIEAELFRAFNQLWQ